MVIEVTDRALKEIEKLINVNGKNAKDKKIRIFLSGIGWSGPRFNLALDEQKENDEIYSGKNVDFVVDKNLISQYKGFKIDYSRLFLRKKFSVYPYSGSGSTC